MALWPTMKADVTTRSTSPFGAVRTGGLPIPLTGERMRIVLRGGLATVSREQVFRNAEENSIEATLTFPIPIHATLYRLTAAIDGRLLIAKAMARGQARNTYERAVDDGKTAVLHEEAVRGIHLLSIAHIPPGAEIKVTHSWISALSPRGAGEALLRIPVTFGDVYGVSPFSDADDLLTSPAVTHTAEVEIDSGTTIASLARASLSDGKAIVRLDRPIDIHFSGMTASAVSGVSADGRGVTVSVLPDNGSDAKIQAAILVDRSGSMAALEPRGASKHATVVGGLAEVALRLGPGDQMELWQFDNTCERVGAPGMPLAEAIGLLGGPQGGTEIGRALNAVVHGSSALDIILITDGLSHALDVQSLANTGRRFTVVLVGEDALEANVGRLAALTGGQIVLAIGAADTAAAVQAAITSVRRGRADFSLETWPLVSAIVHAGGAVIEARWSAGSEDVANCTEFSDAVGAMAAAIAIPRLAEAQAAEVAAEHGIVCHLTSLVLVDEAGAAQAGLPAQRKVPLMGRKRLNLGNFDEFSDRPFEAFCHSRIAMLIPPYESRSAGQPAFMPIPIPEVRPPMLGGMVNRINWRADPEALRRGDISALPADIRPTILLAARRPEIVALVTPDASAIAVVIALIASTAGRLNFAAARIRRAVLKGRDPAAIAKAMTALGL